MVTQATRSKGRDTDLFTPPNGENGNGSYDASDIVTLEGGLKQSASAPACISGAPAATASCTWCGS